MEHDQTVYWGRFRRFYEITDPLTLLVTSSQLEDARSVVYDFEHKPAKVATPPSTDYFRAKRIVDSVLHPETQQPIFLPLRFSAFLPMNLITLLGMLHPSQQTPVRSMTWQWINQTYNVGVNYANGSASGEMSGAKLLTAYSVAVLASCGTAFGLNAWKQKLGPRCPTLLAAFIPFAAVALANIANVAVIRSPDVMEGIPVKDAVTGETLPMKSTAAGRQAVTQVAISRVLVPIPLMLFPPMIMQQLTKPGGYLSSKPHLHNPVQIGIILVLLRFALPLCIAVFPQEGTMSADRLEPEIRGWRNRLGQAPQHVTFNKGL